MPKTIKMNRGCVGQDFVYAAGSIYEAPDDRAADLVQAGHAEYVDASSGKPSDRTEKAVSKAAEKAEKR